MFTVVPGAACEEARKTFEEGLAAQSEEKRLNIFPSSIAGLFTLLFVIGVLSYYVSPLFLILTIYTVLKLTKEIRNYIAEQKLGKIQAELQSTVVYPGQLVPAFVRYIPAEQIPINSATVTLTGEESFVSGSGKNANTHYYKLCQEVFSLSRTAYNEFRGEIKIPETDAYTLITPRDSIKWEVLFYLDIPKLTDSQKTCSVYIVPRKPEKQKASGFGS